MTKEQRISILEDKIQLLTNRDRENANVVRKLERELRTLKGIPKLDVKYTYATNVAAFSTSAPAAKSKKK